MTIVHRIYCHFLTQAAIRSMRTSLLTSGAVLMMSSLGAWQYLGSSFLAMDVHYAASVPVAVPADQQVLVIAIDDSAYQRYFKGQSPLPQERVAKFLETVSSNAIHAQKIVVDLDLAPPLNTTVENSLEDVLQHRSQRWVLASALGATPADSAQRALWRGRRCTQGTSFGSPNVATDFGYVNTTHQYRRSMSDVAFENQVNCTPPELALQLQAAPISPHVLKSGAVLPFSGDINLLAESLRALDPKWIVIGGTWGKDDIFSTPFGDRYGVQVHAAALAGRLAGLHQVPNWIQMLTAWLLVTGVSIILSRISRLLVGWSYTPNAEMPGHRFFRTSLIPIILVFSVLLMLALIGWVLGHGYGLTGIWIPSSSAALVTFIVVMLIWNWGKADLPEGRAINPPETRSLTELAIADLESAFASFSALIGRCSDPVCPTMSRARLAFEGVMSLVSFTLQNVLPIIAVLYIFFKPL
jgi:CHASE2 domain-containing sensor protein